MRLVNCLVYEHHYMFVLFAACMCVVGSAATIGLFRRALMTEGLPRHGWNFLTAVCAGASIWSTHFIAMLGYRSAAPVTLDPVLTLVSVLIAIVGAGLGFAVSARSTGRTATITGGGLLGLSISAMHYTGMFAYRVEGPVSWSPPYIFASIVVSVVLSIGAIAAARRWNTGRHRHTTTALLVAAIVGLHFTGMAAFQVSPIAGLDVGADSDAFRAMALAIFIVGLIIVGTGISSYLIDDRTRATSDAQLHQMAFHDPLTGLANRRALQLRLEEQFASGLPFRFLLVDLDRFKSVNDTFGHTAGDALLMIVAHRIGELLGPRDVAARIGGDELAILVNGNQETAGAVAQEIVRRLAEPFDLGGNVIVIGCSVGVGCAAEAGSVDALMQQSDIALYGAKRQGGNRAFFYKPGMLEEAAGRHQLEAELQTALAAGQIHLLYQPIVELASGRTVGYEALIRWNHPTRGLVSPAEFIPIAEESGQIVAIGAWVLEEACRQAMLWEPDIGISVNVSAVQFRSPLLLAHVTRALAASGLAASRLEVELTETAIVQDRPHVAHTLNALRTLGIKIAMDDFGTGYSSLAHLRDLPLDRIKIDRSFVSTAASDRNSMAVLKAITQLGRDMNIPTLGEGVETAEQLQMLEALGCGAVQGYLTGRPRQGCDTMEAPFSICA